MTKLIEGKAIGGVARANKLTAEQRKEISVKALQAKKEKSLLPKVTHSGTLNIGNVELPCFVLDDGRRVISGRGLTNAIGMKGRGQGAARLANHTFIKNYKNGEMSEAINNPIKFIGKSPKGIDATSDGFEATILQEICEAMLSARDNGSVESDFDKRYVTQADILMRGFARVGIIALVDEATGFQKDRDKDALAKILEAFVAKELQPYVKTFPVEYYENLFRLRSIAYPPANNPNFRPQYFGTLTNDIIYERLAPGLLEEIKKQGRKDEKKAHLHRRLTQELGHPKLKEHLASVVTIMKLSKKYDDFKEKLDHVHPRFGQTYSLDLDDEDK